MTIAFREFPVSYRFSQTGIAIALVCAFFGRKVLQANVPNVARIAVASILGLVLGAALLVSCYVVIRYPFLSLVEPSDGDHFQKHYGSTRKWAFTLVKLIAIFVFLVLSFTLITRGVNDVRSVLALAYVLIMLAFFVFLTFWYDPVNHPTIATFARATMGVGILLFPLFIPVLFVGSIRCRRLLDEYANRQLFGDRTIER